MTDIMANHMLYILCAMSFLFSFICGFFRCFQHFGVLFELVFHSDFIRQKRECSPNADQSDICFSLTKTNNTSLQSTRIQDDVLVYCLRLLVCCFDSKVASFIRHDMLLLHNQGTTIIYPLYEHDFGLPWLWDTDRGNTYISLPIF